MIIGVDIGGSHITSGLVRGGGHLIKETIVKNKTVAVEGDELIELWAATIETVLNDHKGISGIGIAIPGPFDYQNGIALFDGSNKKFSSISNVNVRKALLSYLNFRGEVRFVNDATAFALGEDWVGSAKAYDRTLAITLGTGFGSAIVHDGSILTVGRDVPEDGCFWHLPFRGGIADDYFSTRWLVKRFKKVSGIATAGAKEIADLCGSNHYANQVFTEFGRNLGVFLYPWLDLLASEAVVIGGNIARALNLFQDSLNFKLKELGVSPVILKSELMEEAALIGSTKMLDLKNDPL